MRPAWGTRATSRARDRRLGLWWLVFSLSGALAAGCATGPQARFLRATCEPVQRDGRLEAVVFRAGLHVEGLAGQQVIFGVKVADSHLRPLHSANARFRDAEGHVAASKTLLVPEPKWTFENVQVVIPAEELEIGTRDLPALAIFRVYQPTGLELARQTVMIPVYRSTPPPGRKTVRPPLPPPGGAGPSGRRARLTERARPPTTHPVPEGKSPERMPAWWDATLADLGARLTFARDTLWPTARDGGANPPEASPPATLPSPATARAPAPGPEAGEETRATATIQPKLDSSPGPIRSDPPERWYVVKPGDTLWDIAARELGDSSRWEEILALNRDRVESPRRLQVGQEILLPGKSKVLEPKE